jgi:hypothetical protein
MTIKTVTQSVAWMLLSSFLLTSAAFSAEGRNSIQALYRQCTSSEPVSHAYCAGFIEGVAGSMIASDSVLQSKNLHLNMGWCADENPTVEQMIQAFKNWHDKNPQFWDKQKVIGVIASMRDVWPCRS